MRDGQTLANLASRCFSRLSHAFPGLNKRVRKMVYQSMAGYYWRMDWKFMNYGFDPLDTAVDPIILDSVDEPDRYGIQLYAHVAGAIPLDDLRVLEVGSGRGGGASYVRRYLKPARVVGLDFSEKAVALCNTGHCVEGLSFLAGDAELLPFRDDSFDAVINVESSHCYYSIESFLSEVKRVLRPQGYLLLADFRDTDRLPVFAQQLHGSGLVILRETDITPNVIRALDLDHDRKLAHIQSAVPSLLTSAFKQFAGLKHSDIYSRFRGGDTVYKSYVLQKR